MEIPGGKKMLCWFCRRHGLEAPPSTVSNITIVLSLVAFLLGVSGTARAQTLRVGVLLPLSGRLASIGEMEKTAFSMAAAAVEERGGIQGRELEFVFADTAADPDTGRSAARELITRQDVLALTGGVSSAATWEAANVAEENRVPFLISSASADRITEKGFNYVFRISAPASEQFDALSSFVRTATDIRSAGILWESAMGEFLYRRFLRLFKRIDVRVNMREPFQGGETKPMDLILEAMLKNPDMVCVIARAETGAMLMDRAREAGLNPKAFLGGTTDFVTEGFAAAAGESAEYLYAPTPWAKSVPYPRAMAFYDAFSSASGGPPDYHAAQAFAAAEVLVDALMRTGQPAPEEIQKALAATDLMTVFGPVRFVAYAQKTRQNRAPGFLVQWQRGEPEVVWPRRFATAPYVYPLPFWLVPEEPSGIPSPRRGDSLQMGN
jgi:branched-chain amino acid transport system substrate-binding protein